MTDDFEDDSFMADDLFLAEIDNIAAKAVKRTQSAGPLARPAFKAATTSARPALDSRTTLREGAKPAFSLARPTARTTSAPVHSHGLAGHGQKGSSSEAGPSRLAVESAVAGSSAKPTDNVPLSLEESKRRAAEARRAAIAAASSAKPPTAPAIVKPTDEPSRSTLSRQGTLSFGPGPSPINAQAGPSRPRPPPAAVPSSRLSRTSSGGHGGVSGVQIHLNFRREDQTTKGKRWDRTEYAQSGRRIRAKGKVVKGKAKGKRADMGDGSDVDMDEEDEEGGWDEPLAPDPKPLVDITKPYPPPKHLPVEGVIDKYIYPTNRPKRDYQFEIVQACFTDNCLVALPTGLGKTFVAGVVMLNFYRWFPTGKIVFLAPTKPLVNQQIEACQLTCGIPSIDAAVMTGSSVSAKERAKLWQERRVFYCTPQTLDNDLKARRLDPRDIVLAVFDEAHKASGSYAYTTILAFLMAHQPYFRVLALTATPGADVPKVQGVVDALHISRIEIREAEDPNISKYMNEKHTERHVVAMTDVIEGFRDRWAALMKPYIVKLVEKEILGERDLDAKRLKPFRVTHCRMQIMQDRNSGLKWAIGTLASLDKMARAMTHLLEFSLGMFHTSLLEIAGNMTASGKKATSKGNSNALRNNHEFQRLLRDVEVEMNLIRIGAQGRTKGDGHPKMTQTMELLLAHFSKADEDEKEHGVTNDTRAMVFCSFRECVMDIVDMLNIHSPVLRATRFVGQSQGKQDRDKGFNQKEQKKTINDFKEGKYNVLVSTSIGEEGLDIGEVDFVVIYDMPKQSIKLLQRIGRTGRKRAGQVHVLMSEGREDLNWDKAQDSHREIQEEILHSRNLELFEDVERLLPPGKFPQVEEMEMEVDPWDPENLNEKLAASKAFQKAEKKAKAAGKKAVSLASKMKEERASAPAGSGGRGADIPEDAPVGFKTVAELLREQQAKKAKKQKEEEEEEEDESGRDMDVDAEHGTRVPVTEKPKPKSRTKRKRTVSPVRSESDDDSSRGNELDERDPFAAIVPRAAKKAESSKKAVVDSAQRVKKADVAKPTRKQAKSRNAPSPDVEVDHDEFDDAPEFIDLSDRATNGAGGKANVVTRKEREILPPSSPQYDFGSADLAGIDLSHFDHASPSPPAPKHQTSKNGNRPVRPISVKNTIASVPTLMRSQIPSVPSSGQPLDFFNTSGPIRRAGPSRRGRLPSPPGSPSLSPSPAPSPHKKDTLGHVISSQNLPPSPNTDELLERAAASANCRNEESLATNGRLSPRTARLVGFSQIAPMDMDWELEDDEDLAAELFPNMLGQVGARGAVEGERGAQADEQLVEATPSAPTRRIGLARPIAPGQTRGPGDPSRDPLASGTHGNAGNMLPPPVPPRSGAFALSSPIVPSPTAPGSASRPHLATPTFEATQFPVRRAGVRRKVVVSSSEHGTPMEQLGHGSVVQVDSSPLAPVRQGRFGKKRRVAPPSEASSPPVPPQPRVRGARGAGLGKRQRAKRADVEQLMDINAELSGSASSDESGSDLDRETHSDQVFAGEEFAPTQAPKGYDQRAMHRAGLSTQAGSKAGLGFQPNKRKEAFLAKARKPVYVTDDEASGSENDYELGSFVVDDEDDLL